MPAIQGPFIDQICHFVDSSKQHITITSSILSPADCIVYTIANFEKAPQSESSAIRPFNGSLKKDSVDSRKETDLKRRFIA
jgi:hypothetical protein